MKQRRAEGRGGESTVGSETAVMHTCEAVRLGESERVVGQALPVPVIEGTGLTRHLAPGVRCGENETAPREVEARSS